MHDSGRVFWKEGAALLGVAKIHGIGVLEVVLLCFVILMTQVAAASIENVPTSSMAVASSLHDIPDTLVNRHFINVAYPCLPARKDSCT